MSKTNAWEGDKSSSQKEEKGITTDKNNLLVKIIEDDTNSLEIALGITKTESKRLQNKLHDLLEAENKKTPGQKSLGQVMVDLSKECIHANQLAFICFALGRSTSDKGSGKLKELVQLLDGDSTNLPKGMHVITGDSRDPMAQILIKLLMEMKKKKDGDKDKE